jgi:hypothetical protein
MQATVLDAVVTVLGKAGRPLSTKEIHATIVETKLFTFNTKDELGIVRSAIRRHLKGVKESGKAARLALVARDTYSAVR